MAHRFERDARLAFDDGWETLADGLTERITPPTEVIWEEARSIVTGNDSPDVSFDRSINPYRGCEHGCVYWPHRLPASRPTRWPMSGPAHTPVGPTSSRASGRAACKRGLGLVSWGFGVAASQNGASAFVKSFIHAAQRPFWPSPEWPCTPTGCHAT